MLMARCLIMRLKEEEDLETNTTTDVSNILLFWNEDSEYPRQILCGRMFDMLERFLMANVNIASFEGIKNHKLEVTKPITITNACYGAMFGFIFILFSQGKLGPLELFLTSSKSSHELNGGNVKIEEREREQDEDDKCRDEGERGKGSGNERPCLSRAELRHQSMKVRRYACIASLTTF